MLALELMLNTALPIPKIGRDLGQFVKDQKYKEDIEAAKFFMEAARNGKIRPYKNLMDEALVLGSQLSNEYRKSEIVDALEKFNNIVRNQVFAAYEVYNIDAARAISYMYDHVLQDWIAQLKKGAQISSIIGVACASVWAYSRTMMKPQSANSQNVVS